MFNNHSQQETEILSQSELWIKILGLVIGMPANSDFGLIDLKYVLKPSLMREQYYWFSSYRIKTQTKLF